MAKRGKISTAELSATLEKAIRKLARDVDKKLGKLQDAIAAAREILNRHELQSGGTPPTPPKKAPIKDTKRKKPAVKSGGTPPPPPKAGGTPPTPPKVGGRSRGSLKSGGTPPVPPKRRST